MDKAVAWFQRWAVTKGGPGRGWWGPPVGTHGPGSQGGGLAVSDENAAGMWSAHGWASEYDNMVEAIRSGRYKEENADYVARAAGTIVDMANRPFDGEGCTFVRELRREKFTGKPPRVSHEIGDIIVFDTPKSFGESTPMRLLGGKVTEDYGLELLGKKAKSPSAISYVLRNPRWGSRIEQYSFTPGEREAIFDGKFKVIGKVDLGYNPLEKYNSVVYLLEQVAPRGKFE